MILRFLQAAPRFGGFSRTVQPCYSSGALTPPRQEWMAKESGGEGVERGLFCFLLRLLICFVSVLVVFFLGGLVVFFLVLKSL